MGESRRPKVTVLAGRPHLWAGLLLALVVLGYLWPVLLGGRILSPIADLYSYVPWKSSAPGDLHTFDNLLLLDLPTENYPWRFLVRELLREGTFPAWDPYVLAGIPLYQSPQNGLFSVFNLPLWILPMTYALGLSAAVKLVVGAFGAYLLARQLRLGFLPGVLAGVAFAFAAVNITWLVHDTLPGVVVMVPWALWLIERLFEHRRPRDALGLAVVVAVGLGGGHPGMQVHLLVVSAGYAVLRALCSTGPRLRALVLVGGGLAAGAALMAFLLVPEARSSHGTVGVLARTTAGLPGQHLPFSSLKTAVFPDWWGRPSAIEPASDASNALALFVDYSERTFYAGTVALLLACVGLLARGEWRRKAPFVVLGVAGMALALRAPGLYWLYTHLPVLKDVEAQRLHFAFELGVALLAAFGLQALLDGPLRARAWLGVPLLAVAGGAFALATAHPQPGDVAHTIAHLLHGTGYRAKAVLAMTSVVWFLLFAVGVGVLLALARARPRWRTGVALALVALVVVDAYHFAGNFQPMAPESKVIPPITPAVAYLQRHRADGRIAGVGYAMPNDWPLVYGLRDVRGYDSPQPTQRLYALWLVANPQQLTWTPLMVPGLDPAQAHVVGVLGARYIVTDPRYRVPRGAPATLTAVYRGRDATVLANAGAAPRVLVPRAVRVTADEAGARAAIADPAFDPRTTVAVEGDQPGVAALAEAPLAHGTAAIVQEFNASVTLRTRLDRRGLVMLDDDFTDGWRVRVDGHPASALHVDDVMRGVIVPAGSHEVTWSYTVPGLALGVAISLLTLLGLAGAAVALRLRSRAARR
jgi:membrane protein YfhO